MRRLKLFSGTLEITPTMKHKHFWSPEDVNIGVCLSFARVGFGRSPRIDFADFCDFELNFGYGFIDFCDLG